MHLAVIVHFGPGTVVACVGSQHPSILLVIKYHRDPNEYMGSLDAVLKACHVEMGTIIDIVSGGSVYRRRLPSMEGFVVDCGYRSPPLKPGHMHVSI